MVWAKWWSCGSQESLGGIHDLVKWEGVSVRVEVWVTGRVGIDKPSDLLGPVVLEGTWG